MSDIGLEQAEDIRATTFVENRMCRSCAASRKTYLLSQGFTTTDDECTAESPFDCPAVILVTQGK